MSRSSDVASSAELRAPHFLSLGEAARAPKGSVSSIRRFVSARRFRGCFAESLTVAESAYLLCTSTTTVRQAIRAGHLPAFQEPYRDRRTGEYLHWRWRIGLDDLEAFAKRERAA